MSKNSDFAIAIFVKTPGLSPVKTRLAATIGTTAAEEFYRLSLKAISHTVQLLDCTPYWAVGEEQGLKNDLWKDFQRLYTGVGGLGERQDQVYTTLQQSHSKVLLIGADSPQLTPDLLNGSLDALEQHDFVLGPARDGGYYLFGGRVQVERSVWTSVRYSTGETRSELIRALPAMPLMLPMLTDADTESDFQHIRAEMPQCPAHPQQLVLEWISEMERRSESTIIA